jgi:hypothetical protein
MKLEEYKKLVEKLNNKSVIKALCKELKNICEDLGINYVSNA